MLKSKGRHDGDIETGHRGRRPFTRETFRQLIKATYNEFYGKFRDQFDPSEYMECVDDEELVQRFGPFLEDMEDNLLTQRTMPAMDLGDIPATHSFMKPESQQVYYVPTNKDADLVYIRYSQLVPKYHSRDPKARFEESNLEQRNVNFREFTATLALCSEMMKNYRGKVLLYDWIVYGVSVFGFLFIVLLGIATFSRESGNWNTMLVMIFVYLLIIPTIYKIFQTVSCRQLRQAHFLLAVVCRAENNRFYLKRGVELRPGYLARWVEFHVLDQSKGQNVLQMIRSRHDKAVVEQAKNAEEAHLRALDGVNRDFDTQAIQIRIQIEQINLGRELTAEEQQEIIEH